MKVYDEMAEYYDLIYGDQVDIDFYVQEATNARGSVLELGCGNGRLLLKILSKGIDIQGIDSSGSLLDILKERAKSQNLAPTVFKANMVDFNIEKKFKLIIVPYRAFLHLRSKEDMKKALSNFMKHLDTGGRLILHVYNPSKEDLDMKNEYHIFESEDLTNSDGLKYHLDWSLDYDSSKSLAHYKIDLTLENGKKFEYKMELTFIKMKEIEEMLKDCGYKNVKSNCGFDYLPFSEDCREVLWFAEK